jgi:twitching motility protein PilU
MDLTPLFKYMAEKKGSDMFFSTNSPIQLKVEGITQPINNQVLDSETVKSMAYSLMDEAQIKEFEQKLEMNFAVGIRDVGRYRVNIFRQRGDVAMVIRLIPQKIATMDDLGLPDILRSLIMEKLGLVLMVGATGSGKSTTLAAMVDYRNTIKDGHILTVEDPIEFLHRHKKSIVNQREVGIDTQSYEDAMKSAVREAPEVIMIGEIRDRVTLQQALLFAQTGHLFVSTLHANNSYHALNRIINFFPSDARDQLFYDLSISLRAIISQRLVRTPQGKRVAAIEVLINTSHIADLIRKGQVNEIKEAMEKSMSPGSQTFEQALYRMYKEGTITLDEAMKNADSPTNLSWLVNNADNKDRDSAITSSKASAPGTEGEDSLSSITISPDILNKI